MRALLLLKVILLITLSFLIQNGDANHRMQKKWFKKNVCKIFPGVSYCKSPVPKTTEPAATTILPTTTKLPIQNKTEIASNVCNCKCGERKLGIFASAYKKFKGLFQKRIVGGKSAKKHSHPWLARLSNINNQGAVTHMYTFCGGSILNKKFILTAAHCVLKKSPRQIAVIMGDHDQISKEEADHVIARVQNIHIHSNYNPNNHDNDIALLEMLQPITFRKHIKPICIPSYEKDPPAASAWAVGWGRKAQSVSFQPDVLKEVKVPMLSHLACSKMTKYAPEAITDNMLCAGTPGSDSCQGDSGGPLVVEKNSERMEIHGVVSWGIGCGEYGYPGVYAKVFKYLDWMKKIMKTNCINCL